MAKAKEDHVVGRGVGVLMYSLGEKMYKGQYVKLFSSCYFNSPNFKKGIGIIDETIL